MLGIQDAWQAPCRTPSTVRASTHVLYISSTGSIGKAVSQKSFFEIGALLPVLSHAANFCSSPALGARPVTVFWGMQVLPEQDPISSTT